MFSLSEIPREESELDSFRIQAAPDYLEKEITAKNLDARRANELMEFLRVDNAQPLARFDETPRFFNEVHRFAGGSPVLYTALEKDTCFAEIKHLIRKIYGGAEANKITLWKTLFDVRFRGSTKDLTSQLGACPDLISEDYAFCNSLAVQAASEDLDGLVAPSARFAGGKNLPVFRKHAVLSIDATDCIPFTYDPTTDSIDTN